MTTLIRWALKGQSTMALNKATSDVLEHSKAVEDALLADAKVLADSLGRRVTVETADGVELTRFATEPR